MGKNYQSKAIRGKLKVYNILAQTPICKEYLPKTIVFSEKNLEFMSEAYPILYLKPNIGSQGLGIYRLKKENNTYILQSTKYKAKYNTLKEIYQRIKEESSKQLIIQQGIEIEKINNRPYDIRVMVQHKPKEDWVVTGIFAKWGKLNKIVTNYYQGGELVTLENLYKEEDFSKDKLTKRVNELAKLSLEIARVLNNYQKGMYEIGIDFAYDENGKLWVLEVNSREPQFYPIKKIDAKMYYRMLEFAKSYGRKSGY